MTRVLVVEDDADIAEELADTLASLGYAVTAVVSRGEDAIAAATAQPPDLVLLDVRLAGKLDGIETAEGIRGVVDAAIVFTTAHADDATVARAKSGAPGAYLVKPYGVRELHSSMQIALERHHLEMRLRRSEGKLSATLDSIADAVISISSAGHVERMNPAAERLTGWPMAEGLGRPLAEVYCLLDETTHEPIPLPAPSERVAPEPGGRKVLLLRAKNGRERWIAESSAPVVDNRGHGSGFVLVFRDLTAEREAEAAANRARRDFHSLIEGMRDAVVISRHEYVAYVNDAFCAMLGYARDELVGKNLHEFMHPEERTRARARAAAIKGETVASPSEPPATSEWRFVRKDGDIATIEFTRARAIEFEGAPAYFGVGRDLSERKRMEARLLLADRMVSLGTMAAGVAHEINNPLAYILGNLEHVVDEVKEVGAVLARTGDAEDAHRLTEVISAVTEARTGAERVRRIVRDLGVLSRAPDQKIEPVDVERVIDSAIGIAETTLRERARLVKDYGGVRKVIGNDSRLGQVFLNLLLNAAQAIPDGLADDNEIRVSTREVGGRVIVSVKDTGAGIEPSVLGRIFDPFFTTKPVGKGTGLGLSICHGLVSGLGGEITVESEPGKGALFRVTLPAALPSVAPSAAQPDASASAPTARGRVLVIDDESMVVASLRRTLARDHEVETETSARAAQARFASGERFDVILCDIMMPEMTGMALYESIRTIAPDQLERIVFLTGGAFTQEARLFLGAVPNDRVDKPFDVRKLRALVRTKVEQVRAQSESA